MMTSFTLFVISTIFLFGCLAGRCIAQTAQDTKPTSNNNHNNGKDGKKWWWAAFVEHPIDVYTYGLNEKDHHDRNRIQVQHYMDEISVLQNEKMVLTTTIQETNQKLIEYEEQNVSLLVGYQTFKATVETLQNEKEQMQSLLFILLVVLVSFVGWYWKHDKKVVEETYQRKLTLIHETAKVERAKDHVQRRRMEVAQRRKQAGYDHDISLSPRVAANATLSSSLPRMPLSPKQVSKFMTEQ